MGFIFARGNFREEDKSEKTRKLPHAKISTFTVCRFSDISAISRLGPRDIKQSLKSTVI